MVVLQFLKQEFMHYQDIQQDENELLQHILIIIMFLNRNMLHYE